MKFKRLRLVGFKSFVDPMELVIEDGLTGILGPNGCGKSNLLEALRWVMGETSAKSMRGDGMDDVIFAGTDKRPPRPFAEVILTIDNSDRTAPAMFNTSDTLEISRRIAREMGSTYRINGKEVRAKDVQMLFADASTGANSPALVRQGQISALIQAKPKSRRMILEEAAGISGLYSRRAESETRLKATEANLERLGDTLKNLDVQLTKLDYQAKQAQKYRALSQAIRQTESAFLSRQYYEIAEQILKAEQTFRSTLVENSTFEREIASLTEAETKAIEGITPLRDELAIASTLLQRSKLEIGTLIQQENDLRGRIDRQRKALEGLKNDFTREMQLKTDSEGVLQRLRTDLHTIEQEDNQAPTQELHLKQDLEEALIAQKEQEKRVEDLTSRFHEAQANARRIGEELDSARARKRRIEDDFIRITKERETLDALMKADTRLSETRGQVANLREKINVHKTTLDELEQKRMAHSHSERDQQNKFNTADQLVGRLRAEIKGLSAALGRDDEKQKNALLHQIEVEQGFEQAVGITLGEDLNYGTDPKAAGYWQSLPPFGQEQHNSTLPDSVEPLQNHVTAPAVLHRALSQIGFVKNAQQAETLQPLLKAGQQLVSSEGAIWRWDGLTIRSNAPSRAAVRLEQKNKLNSLEKELLTAMNEAQKESNTLKVIREQGLTVQNQINGEKQVLRQIEEQLNKAVRSETDLERSQATQIARLQALGEQIGRIEEEVKLATENQDRLMIQMEGLASLDPLRDSLDEGKKLLEQLRAKVTDTRTQIDILKRLVRDRQQKIEGLKRDINDWQKRLQTADERKLDLEKRQTELEKTLKDSEGQPELLAEKKLQATKNLPHLEERHKRATDNLAVGEGEVTRLAKVLRDTQSKVLSLQEKKVRAETQIETLKSRQTDMESRIQETLRVAPHQLKTEYDPQLDELPAVFLEKQLNQHKHDRDQLGAVNLVAEQEMEDVAGEKTKLITERDDLTEAINRLRQGIDHLNKEGREKLLSRFETVNGHFKRLFRHLFGGGIAELELVESDDPLEAGLEIFAQPPGKKTRALSLMSGGEQALTCLALIFAVFLTNPSPVCVLDEVDAPLDDANVGRYCELLNEMTRVTETRFLVITHNPLTMARMDRLFGVTMAERGVSQLVSVDLQAAERLVSS